MLTEKLWECMFMVLRDMKLGFMFRDSRHFWKATLRNRVVAEVKAEVEAKLSKKLMGRVNLPLRTGNVTIKDLGLRSMKIVVLGVFCVCEATVWIAFSVVRLRGSTLYPTHTCCLG